MAIGPVVTRGYGSGGSIALVVTRGYLPAVLPVTSEGFCVHAASTFIPGPKATQAFIPGPTAVQAGCECQ
jgi:hypothetical protein